MLIYAIIYACLGMLTALLGCNQLAKQSAKAQFTGLEVAFITLVWPYVWYQIYKAWQEN
jgi:hypothetical protein